MEVYRRMHCDFTPSLVYGLASVVAAVTIESMGVTPPCLWFSLCVNTCVWTFLPSGIFGLNEGRTCVVWPSVPPTPLSEYGHETQYMTVVVVLQEHSCVDS